MNILFLDFDGVLNTDDFRDMFGQCFNPFLVHNLASILFQFPDCKIVISSDWRHGSKNDIIKAISCNGFIGAPSFNIVKKITDSIHDITPDFGSRSGEILSWVEWAHEDGIKIDNWVAIDDLDLELPEEHFVKTNPEFGLQEDKANEVIKKFNKV